MSADTAIETPATSPKITPTTPRADAPASLPSTPGPRQAEATTELSPEKAPGSNNQTKVTVKSIFDNLDKKFNKRAAEAASPPALPELEIETETSTTPPAAEPLQVETTPAGESVLPAADSDPKEDTDEEVEKLLGKVDERLKDEHLSNRDRKNLTRLSKAYRAEKGRREAADKARDEAVRKAEEAAKAVKVPDDYEPTKAERDRLRLENQKFMRREQLVNDPEFNKPYVERTKTLNTAIEQSLLRAGVPEGEYIAADGNPGVSLKFIRENGGMRGLAEKRPDLYASIVDTIGKNNKLLSTTIERNVSEQVTLESEREGKLAERVAQTEEHLAGLSKQQQQTAEQQQANRQSAAQILVKHREEIFGKNDIFKMQTAAADAKPEEVKRIADLNADAKTNRELLEKVHRVLFFNEGTPDDKANAALEYVQARALRKTNETLTAQNKELQKKLDGIYAAQRIRQPGGHLNGGAVPNGTPPPAVKVATGKSGDAVKGFGARLDQIAREKMAGSGMLVQTQHGR